MQSARIAPYRTCLISPVHPRNAIVIVRDHAHHVVMNDLVLIRMNAVDACDVH